MNSSRNPFPRTCRARFLRTLLPPLLFLIPFLQPAMGGIVDPGFQCVLGADDGEVLAALTRPDGTTLIGGKFTSVAGQRRLGIARILADGSVDPGFKGGAIGGSVYALAVDSMSRVVIGGDFTLIDGISRPGVARLLPNGSLDGGFNPGTGAMLTTKVYGAVNAVVVDPLDRVLVGGNFKLMNGKSRVLLARLGVDGTVDESFDPGNWTTASSQAIRALTLLGDQIVAGGSFAALADTATRRNIARFNANGSLDLAFDPGGACDTVNAVLAEPNGSVTAAGYRFVRRLHYDGSHDDAFHEPDFSKSQNADVKTIVHALGGCVIGGDFRKIRTGQNLLAVTYGQEKFVAVDSIGSVWISTDGASWAVASSPSHLALRGIAYGNGNFVAVGEQGTRITSPDAVHWTANNSLGIELFNGVYHAQNQFVAVGATIDGQGAIFTSPDGSSWTRRISGTGKELHAVTCRLEEQWIAVGEGGAILTSPDGIHWTTVPSVTSRTLRAVASMDAPATAVAVGDGGTILLSTDGTNWLPRQSGTIDPLRAITTGLSKFTVGGGWGSLRTTVNTTNWFSIYSPTLLHLNAAAASPTQIVFVGDSEIILTSLNQQTWTQQRNQASDVRYVAHLDDNGLLQTNFNSGIGKSLGIFLTTAPELVRVVQPAAEGKLFVGGGFTHVDNARSPDFTRLLPDGTKDTNFNVGTGTGGATAPGALLREPDGRILIGGDFTSVNGIFINRITRLTPNGSIDPDYNTGCDPQYLGCGADRPVYVFARMADGRVVVGGDFNSINGEQRRGVARLFADGSVDRTFKQPASSPAYNSPISVVAVQPDGRVLIDGSSKRLMRLDTNGVPDASFNIGTGVTGGYVTSILQPEDGGIVVGGSFTGINGTTVGRLARLDYAGNVDLNFQKNLGTGANNTIETLIFQWDEALKQTFILAAGGFSQINGEGREKAARILLDGRLDPEFLLPAGTDKNISLLTTYYDKVATPYTYMAGDFTNFAGFKRSRIARWLGGVGLDANFNSRSGPNGRVTTMILFDDRRILIGGNFTTVDDEPWPNLALLRIGDPAPAPLEEWKSQYFSVAEQSDPTVSGDNADPDQDGLVNLVEYAFSLNPRTASHSGLPTGAIESDAGTGEEYILFAFRRRVGASGVQYTIELSDDLAFWTAAGVRLQIRSVTPDPGGATEVVQARVTPALQPNQKSFIRVVVTKD